MVVHVCKSDEDFRTKIGTAGSKPVLVMFTMERCGACKAISPLFNNLSDSYSSSISFLEADIRSSSGAALSVGVTCFPSFFVYVNGNVVSSLKGANKEKLEEIVRSWSKADSDMVPGFLQLEGNIMLNQIECSNACDDTPASNFFGGSQSVLRSDCDEQLILGIPFKQPVKLHSIFVKGNGGKAPKVVRVFINLPRALDFDDAQAIEPTQILEFGNTAGETGELLALKYVKFQNVHSLQLFIENNQEGGEVTELTDLKFFGMPNNVTRMDDFKRVSGDSNSGH
ncbi:unnamed protein product [Auanema sp. JU1783]|nr:unnamed protein product [Auanema sp. JU1783]